MTWENLERREILRALSSWPTVCQAVDEAGPLPASLSQPSVLGDVPGTLVIGEMHLSSCVDRASEAELQGQSVPDDAEEATVYGVAMGDLSQHLLKTRVRLKKLRVVVFHPGVLAASMQHALQSGDGIPDWLSDPRVELVLARSLAATLTPPFAVAPGSLTLAEDAALPLRDAVILALSEPYELRRHQEREPMLQASMVANASRMDRDGDVTELFGSGTGKRAVIAAGGPTLSLGMDWIRTQRDSIHLVAVSTALLPLQHAGLVPDVVVVIDPKPILIEHFQGLDLPQQAATRLVYTPAVQPKVLDLWPGPRFCAYLPQPRFSELRRRQPRGELYCGATVTHAAVDLAVKMGCTEVVLWGADFAYLDGRSHAAGAAQERGVPNLATATVVSADGKRLRSDLNLIGFLRDLEAYIARTPSVRFYLGSEQGAAIRGTKPLPS